MPGLIFTQKHLKATAKSEFKNKHKEKLFWGQLSSLTHKKTVTTHVHQNATKAVVLRKTFITIFSKHYLIRAITQLQQQHNKFKGQPKTLHHNFNSYFQIFTHCICCFQTAKLHITLSLNSSCMAFTAFKLQTFLANFVKNLQKQTTLPDPPIKSLKSSFSSLVICLSNYYY